MLQKQSAEINLKLLRLHVLWEKSWNFFCYFFEVPNNNWQISIFCSLNTLQRACYQPVNHELVWRLFDKFLFFDSILYLFIKIRLRVLLNHLQMIFPLALNPLATSQQNLTCWSWIVLGGALCQTLHLKSISRLFDSFSVFWTTLSSFIKTGQHFRLGILYIRFALTLMALKVSRWSLTCWLVWRVIY